MGPLEAAAAVIGVYTSMLRITARNAIEALRERRKSKRPGGSDQRPMEF
jgi:hypothetical protein